MPPPLPLLDDELLEDDDEEPPPPLVPIVEVPPYLSNVVNFAKPVSDLTL